MARVNPTGASAAAREFDGHTIVVLGLGRFGGGVGAARWLCEQGAHVIVTDRASEDQLADSLYQLRDWDIEFHLGGHPTELLRDASMLVVNPAVNRRENPFVEAARNAGLRMTSEIELFVQRCPARIVGVTGSVGKSTTAAMIAEVLRDGRRDLRAAEVWLGGNLGGSLLSRLPAMMRDDWVVLELSSFQLEHLDFGPARIPAVVLTTLQPHHLERHGTFEAYVACKLNLLRAQSREDHVFIGAGAHRQLVALGIEECPARPVVYDVDETLRGCLGVPGDHQLFNASAALAVADTVGVPADIAEEALAGFSGLPHRLQRVRELGGVTYYNDSKSTTPEACMTALDAMENEIILLVGGTDRGVDYDVLAQRIFERVRVVISFGAARNRLSKTLREHAAERSAPVIRTVRELDGAVQLAHELARTGDAVLLSPGCPSYDQFNNYQQRGDRFCQLVHAW